MPGPENLQAIRMFGVTRDGRSVCCHVHGFSAPCILFVRVHNITCNDLASFKDELNRALIADLPDGNTEGIPDIVLMVEIIKRSDRTSCAAGSRGDNDETVVRIKLSHNKFVHAAKRLIPQQAIYRSLAPQSCDIFESTDDIVERFMKDNNILGCVWIELPPNKWLPRASGGQHDKVSTCQIECDVYYEDLIAHAPEGEWSDVAKFTILSFDLECSPGGTFPNPRFDPVYQIANVVQLHGENEVKIRNVFCVKSCAPIENAEVYWYEKEAEMLEAWAKFVRELDPDIITGYNISHFDFPYLLDRANHLNVKNFNTLGRLINVRSQVRKISVPTKTKGNLQKKSLNINGRVVYDAYLIVLRDLSLPKYTLDVVSYKLLGDRKDNVDYTEITPLQNGDDLTRRRLAKYCLKDAELPMRVINQLSSIRKDIEKARVESVPIASLCPKKWY